MLPYAHEKRVIFSLALIYAFRMLGLFMILPVFAPYAHQLQAATPTLIGLALGIYGLSQALLQIPFGLLSDRIGRKPVLTVGLILFAIGSIVAANSHHIIGVILGRALQGAGAIGSTLTATMADLTREENRTKAMASIGMTIGSSFMIAILLGPLLKGWIGVAGIFWLTAGLACGGLIIVHTLIPTPTKLVCHSDTETIPSLFRAVLSNRELLRLNFGIFSSHAIMTGIFVAIPMILQQTLNISSHDQWQLYLPILFMAFIAMLPFIIIAEKKRAIKPVFLGAIALMGLAQLGLWLDHTQLSVVALCLFLYFSAFSLLEALLPSLVSKIAPVASKGTAMGIYSSSQFLGIFFGGTFGGWLYGNHHIAGVFYASALLALAWLIIASSMKKPRHLSSQYLHLGNINRQQAQHIQQQLQQIPGVAEVAISLDEGTAYLKVDKDILNQETLSKLKLGENYG